MQFRRALPLFLVSAITLGLSVGCEGFGGEISLTGNQHQIRINKIQFKYSFSFDMIGVPADLSPQPELNLVIDGYPYNRLILEANTRVPGASTTTPMELGTGNIIPISIQVGPQTLLYQGRLATLSTLSPGQYVIDAPGAVEDVKAALLNNPGYSAQVSLSLNVIGGPIGSIINVATGGSNFVYNLDSSSNVNWSNLITTHDEYNHPGPIIKTIE